MHFTSQCLIQSDQYYALQKVCPQTVTVNTKHSVDITKYMSNTMGMSMKKLTKFLSPSPDLMSVKSAPFVIHLLSRRKMAFLNALSTLLMNID